MLTLAGPYWAAALLLVAAGAPKVVRPAATARALRELSLPTGPSTVRLVGGAEVLIGLAAVGVGGALPALAVGVSYACFTAVVVLALRRGGSLSSCGCLGKADTPPTPLHLALNLAAAAVAFAAVLRPVPSLAVLAARPPLGGALLAYVGFTVWFAYLALSALAVLRTEVAGGRR